MKIEIDLKKSLQENASDYYAKSKVAKKKLAGVEKALEDTSKRISSLEKKKPAQKEVVKKKKKQKKWYEKFHWCISSDGFLILAGRDAKSNENLVKKHLEPTDLYFHADIHGAPHTIVKSKDNSAPQTTKEEAAQFAATLSRGWRDKFSHADVYSVLPDQVSKSAPSGEAIGTGAFMIYGKRNWFRKTPLAFAIGINKEYELISGPPSAVKKHASYLVQIRQGKLSKGELAKEIKKNLAKKSPETQIDLDEIISMLPAGGAEIA